MTSVTCADMIALRSEFRERVVTSAGQIEQDALAQAAAPDLQRLAERLRRGVEREQPGGHQPHALDVEVEAEGDVRGRTAGEQRRARAARLSGSSTSPTSRRSDAALPPTATAVSTGRGSMSASAPAA